MKKLLLFVTLLLLGANLSVCYADAPKGETPGQTVKVLKETVKAHNGKDSTYVEVLLDIKGKRLLLFLQVREYLAYLYLQR